METEYAQARNGGRQVLAVPRWLKIRPSMAAITLTCTVLTTLVWLVALLPVPAGAQDPTDSSVGGSVLSGDGVGVGDIKVDLFFADENGRRGQFLGTTRSGPDGGFAFDVDPGCFVLTVISPDERRFDGSRWFQPSACVESDEQVTDLVARFDSERDAALGGMVVARLGSPISGVTANLFTEGRARFLGVAVTDSDGVFRFDVAAGCYVVTLIAPPDDTFVSGSRFFQRNICLPPGQENLSLVATVDLVLIEPSLIGGIVRSSIDQGVEGVRVTAYRTTESGGRGEFLGRALTDVDGRWAVEVTEGCYRFIVIAPDNDGFGPTYNRYYELPVQCVGADEELLTLQARLRQPNPTSVEMTTGRSFIEGGEGETKTALVRVSVSGGTTFPVTVNLRTVDGAATVADGDYDPVSVTLRFEPGDGTKTVPVTIHGDKQAEIGERFFLLLSNPEPSAGVFIHDDIFPVYIRNDDGPVTFEDPAVTPLNDIFNESDGTVSARLFASGGPTAEPGSVDVTLIALNAVAGQDFRVGVTQVDLPSAGGDFSFPIEILDDDILENTESFLMMVSNPSPGVSITDPFAVIRIRDDDPIPD